MNGNNILKKVQKILSSPDIIYYEFKGRTNSYTLVYADGLTDKLLIGELIIKPLMERDDNILCSLAAPEVSKSGDLEKLIDAISNGDVVVFDNENAIIVGIKSPPSRAVIEPPTEVVVRGPREGFIEDMKVNCALVRKRIKSPKLQITPIVCGKQSKTNIAIVYIDGITPQKIIEHVKERIKTFELDVVCDSSYISRLISSNPKSLFRHVGTCEKPDIFCARIVEGRVGIIVDGSPIALTCPYLLMEDFQSAEDYYTTPYRATTLRILRLIAVIMGVLLPAIYICAQLFKIGLIPQRLLSKIASSASGIPLSPSVELLFTLFILEVLNEASIRMPKYVGLALSIVGALVLGDTMVKAGIVSTPAVIIVAISAICLYTVPHLISTTTTLRWIFLFIAGSIGTFGVLLFCAFLLCYLCSERSSGVPLLSPFAPTIYGDLADSFYKGNMLDNTKRPIVLGSKNKTRLKKI